MKKHLNKLAILFVLLSTLFVIYLFVSAPIKQDKMNALKTASWFEHELKELTKSLKVMPNKPEAGDIIVQGVVEDQETLNLIQSLAEKYTDQHNEIILKVKLEKKTSPKPN